VKRMTFSAPEELAHIRRVYGAYLHDVPEQRLVAVPLFGHLLTAER
jgi:hypothetical protein